MKRTLLASFLIFFPFLLSHPFADSMSTRQAQRQKGEQTGSVLQEITPNGFCQHPPCTNWQVTVQPALVNSDSSLACRGRTPSYNFTVNINETAGVGATVSEYQYQFFDVNSNPLPPVLLRAIDFARDFNAQGGNIVGRIRSFDSKTGNICISFDNNLARFGYVSFSGKDDNNNDFCFSTPLITLNKIQNNQGADLSITNVGSKHKTYRIECNEAVIPGNQLLYTITIENKGPTTATNVSVNDFVLEGTVFKKMIVSQGAFTAPAEGQPGTITCSLGSMPPGTSATIWLFLKVTAIPAYFIRNQAIVTSTSFDPDTSNNSATETTILGYFDNTAVRSNYSIVTNIPRGNVSLGKRLTYTITVTDTNSNSYQGDNMLVDILPAGTTFAESKDSIYTPQIGSTGIVMFRLPYRPNEPITYDVTVNVIDYSTSLANCPMVIQGGLTRKDGVPYSPCQYIGCNTPSPGDSTNIDAANPSFVSFGGTIRLDWQIASPGAGDTTPAPRLGGSGLVLESPSLAFAEQYSKSNLELQADPCTLIGYKLYLGQTPDVDTSESNVWKILPPDTNTTTAPRPPEGAYYALRAMYLCPDGSKKDSVPSNVVSSGVGASTCTLTCTANQIVSTPSVSGTTVNYSLPATSGSCGTTSCSPASGSLFPIGTTTVTCTSATGNGRCTFNVIVNSSSSGPRITATQKSGKNLVVLGSGFVDGSKLFVNDEERRIIERTATSLTGKKVAKGLLPGAMIQVKNPDGSVSNLFNYQP